MHKHVLAGLMVSALAISASSAWAAQPASNAASATTNTPTKVQAPARPTALTPAQFESLCALEAAPEHSKVLQSSATYAPPEKGVRWQTVSDDVWTLVYDVGWPGAYLAIVICAL